MDCEKFDQIIIDAVYDELDELTLAAAKRHADSCQHCQAAWSGLRATRKIGLLPLVEAPAGLEAHVLQAAREAHRDLPWPKRVGRAISWAGSYAMRPQMAMAALLVLMLGSSVIFLRAKPDRSGALSRISVTERGVPEQAAEEPRSDKKGGAADERPTAGGRLAKRDDERGSGSPVPMAPSPFAAPLPEPARLAEAEARPQKGLDREPMADMAARPKSMAPAAAPTPDDPASGGIALRSAAGEKKREAPGGGAIGSFGAPAPSTNQGQDAFSAATDLYTAGRYAEAEKAFDEIEASHSKDAPRAALMAAKSSENAFSCGKAAPKYEMAWAHYSASSPGAEALSLAADCYTKIANYGKAHDLLIQLRSVAGYRDRAEDRLANLAILQQQQMAARARAASAPPAKPAPALPAPPAPPKATNGLK